MGLAREAQEEEEEYDDDDTEDSLLDDVSLDHYSLASIALLRLAAQRDRLALRRHTMELCACLVVVPGHVSRSPCGVITKVDALLASVDRSTARRVGISSLSPIPVLDICILQLFPVRFRETEGSSIGGTSNGGDPFVIIQLWLEFVHGSWTGGSTSYAKF